MIDKRFAVTIAERTVAKLLHTLGLSRLSPRPRHPKQATDAQEEYKKLRWRTKGMNAKSTLGASSARAAPARANELAAATSAILNSVIFYPLVSSATLSPAVALWSEQHGSAQRLDVPGAKLLCV